MKHTQSSSGKAPNSSVRSNGGEHASRVRSIPLRYRLLFADEDLGLYAALSVAFRRHLEFSWAPTNADALRSTIEAAPDLLIVADARPAIDPLWVVHAVRGHQPQCSVVLTSRDGDPSLIRDLGPLRVAGFLKKPMAVAEFVHLLSALIKPNGREPSLASGLSSYVGRAVEYVSQHYQEATVKGVVAAVGVSYGYLAHLIQTELGLTLGDYIAQVRIEVCKFLLVKTDHKLEHIAESVGFCDAPHLSRRFHAYVGRRPGEFRRQPTETAARNLPR